MFKSWGCRTGFAVASVAGVLLTFATNGSAYGQTRVFMVPSDVVVAPGQTVVVQIWAEDTVSGGVGPVRTYQMTTPCSAAPLGAVTGTVTHTISAGSPPLGCSGGQSPCVNVDNPEWVFAPIFAVASTNTGDCDGSGFQPRTGAAAFSINDAQDITVAKYLTEVAFTASADATGDFGVTIQNPEQGGPGDSFLHAQDTSNIPFLFDDPGVVIHVVDLCAGVDCSFLDDDCNNGVCDPGTGGCLAAAKPDGTLCTSDGNDCTSDVCAAGVCTNDPLPPGIGCMGNGTSDCSGPDTCDGAGGCQDNDAGAGTACTPDANDCTDDVCDGAGSCTHANSLPGTACGNQGGGDCDDPDTCDGAGGCNANNIPDGTGCTSDGNVCTDDVCGGGACQHNNNTAPCSDGDACTLDDACVGGACVPGQDLDCSFLDDDCNDGVCDSGTGDCLASAKPNGTSCTSDGNDCTNDVCDSGVCTHDNLAPGVGCAGNGVSDCSGPDTCDGAGGCQDNDAGAGTACTPDANDCTDDVCDGAGSCTHANSLPGTACGSEGGGDCDDPDTCDGAGGCNANNIPDGTGCTSDGNVCTDDVCGGGACQHNNNTAPCSDGDACTLNDACLGGACVPGQDLDCNDDDVCTDDFCAGGVCGHSDNTAPCDDAEDCTQDDTCSGGVCIGGEIDCDDDNVCTADTCAGGVCEHAPVAGSCDDGDQCTIDDICSGGVCISGAELDCDDGNECTDDVCLGGTCLNVNNNSPCDDGDACTIGDTCSGGACASGGQIDCDDGNVCTDDSCVLGICQNIDNAAPCDDAEECTENDTCSAGQCAGTQIPGCFGETVVSCELVLNSSSPGGTATLEVFVEDVPDLRAYQTRIEITKTSGTGEVAVPCPDGVEIDAGRPDWVFLGVPDVFVAVDCDNMRLGAAILAGSVNVIGPPDYLGTYFLDVSLDATAGSTFEISFSQAPNDTFLRNSDSDPIEFTFGPPCVLTIVSCESPLVVGTGGRSISVTPQPADSTAPVALLLTSPNFPCLSKYIDASGQLVVDPVFLTPAEWGTLIVSDQDIVPSTNTTDTVYHVQADCGGGLTAPGAGITLVWGDLDDNNVVDFDDILLLLEAFAGNFQLPIEALDMFPCDPDGAIDFDDILQDLNAFAGDPFPCAAPCAP